MKSLVLIFALKLAVVFSLSITSSNSFAQATTDASTSQSGLYEQAARKKKKRVKRKKTKRRGRKRSRRKYRVRRRSERLAPKYVAPFKQKCGEDRFISPVCGCSHPGCILTSSYGYRRMRKRRCRPRRYRSGRLVKRRGKILYRCRRVWTWDMHHGFDFSGPRGTPVRAMASGTVVLAASQYSRKYRGTNRLGICNFGTQVFITHDKAMRKTNGRKVNQPIHSGYIHLARVAPGITSGTKVKQGQIIGYINNSGFSLGNHLDVKFYKELPFDSNYDCTYHKGGGHRGEWTKKTIPPYEFLGASRRALNRLYKAPCIDCGARQAIPKSKKNIYKPKKPDKKDTTPRWQPDDSYR